MAITTSRKHRDATVTTARALVIHYRGRFGDHVLYDSMSESDPLAAPYGVTLDLVEHTSVCDCTAGIVGRYLCKHQRGAVSDWYGRRARIVVGGETPEQLGRRAAQNLSRVEQYARLGREAREEGDYERAVRWDGLRLRCDVMLEAIADETLMRDRWPAVATAV